FGSSGLKFSLDSPDGSPTGWKKLLFVHHRVMVYFRPGHTRSEVVTTWSSPVQDGSGDRTVLAARRSQAHLWKAAAAIPVQHSARPCLCVAGRKNLIFAVGDRNYVQVLACTTAATLATLASTSPEDHCPGPATSR